MSSLLDRLKKTSTVKQTALLTDSILMNERDMCKTAVPILNVALSGSVNGGLCDGLTVVAGESKTFKSNLSLLMASAYLKEHEDAALLLYDSEFGITPEYLESMHIDTSRVIHTPVEHLEQLKFDLVKQMTELDRKDKVVVVIDSIGNLASKKELTDVLDQKSKSDMTRAKEVKALFRQVTPYLTTKACPLIVIAHTYKSQDLYPTDVLAGGCLEAGTKIQLSNGELKEVQDFEVGDMVKTLDGDREVTYVWNPETLADGTPECYEIEFDDGTKVVCSDEHKFLIDGSWVEACDLVGGEDVTTYSSVDYEFTARA